MFFQLILDSSSKSPVVSGGAESSAWIVILAIAMLALVGFGIVKAIRSSSSTNDWDALNRAKIRKTWNEISALASQGPITRKLAIIEADKLVDHTLKALGFPGETMSERMKVAEYKHPKIREMWQAHKWRNQLVHEADFSLSERQTKEALRGFEAVLKSLRALV